MNKLIDELFTRKKFVLFIFIVLLGYGVYSYLVIPKQDMPEMNTPYMLLTVEAQSLSATEIEDSFITDIEELVATYKDVNSIKTTIYDNYALVLVVFSFQTDNPSLLSKSIFEKTMELSLPDTITSITYSNNFDDPHIIYALHSDTLDDSQLISYGKEFKNELLTINQINSIQVHSSFDKEVEVLLDSVALASYKLTFSDVYQIIISDTTDIPLGYLTLNGQSIPLNGNVTFSDLDQLKNILIIPEIEGVSPSVTLGDISNISYVDSNDLEYRFNGNSTIFLSIHFDEDIDFTKLGSKVQKVTSSFDSENTSINIDEVLFLPDYVESQISNVVNSLAIAILIVMIVVFIGIGLKNSLLVIITIPIIVFSTISILYIGNLELHKLSIVGLIVSIGILVDNQIVITEGIKRNLEDGYNITEAAKLSIKNNFAPVLSSSLTTIAAFIVVALLPGFLGEIVRSMPLTVIITVVLSFIVSMTLSPIIATIFIPKSQKKSKITVHEKRIKKMIERTLKFPLIWVIMSIVIFASTMYLSFTQLQVDLYPNDERSVLYVDFEGEINDKVSTTLLHDKIIDEITNEDKVLNYSSSIGGDLPNFHFSSKLISNQPHIGRILINLDMNEDELLDYKESLEKTLLLIDESVSVNTIELSPPLPPVRVILSNTNYNKLNEESEKLLEELSDSENIKSIDYMTSVKSPKFSITYNKEVMTANGISKYELDQFIALNANGINLGSYDINDESIVIQLNTSINTIDDFLALAIHSKMNNDSILLSSLILIEVIYDYSVIIRQEGSPVSIIDLYPESIDNFELQNYVENVRQENNIIYSNISYDGENQMFEEISNDLIYAFIIALVLIFMIMFIQFNNIVKPFIIFSTIPLSFTGSLLFLLIFKQEVTATSLVGIVSLIGVTVNTGILLVEYITRDIELNKEVKTACINAVYLRFRPIMLTSITTILGLIPLLITGGNFFRPLAITFMGGLVTSTLITLFLVPSFFYLIYRNRKSIQ